MVFASDDMPEDLQLDDWIPIFEPLENSEAFSDERMLYRLREKPSYENEAGVDSLAEGENENIYDMTEMTGAFWFHWGPVHAQDGLMLNGSLFSAGDHEGDAVSETETSIADQYPAPYITEVREDDGHGDVEVQVPTDYDQEDWEETVDALVEISAEIGQYQDDLEAVSEQYRT